MPVAIRVENVSKAYQLGEFTSGTLSRDLERWWALYRGKEDPFLTVGETNDRSVKGSSDIVWSLKDLNFEIQQGDAVGIIGKNGAGKSTLLKVLSQVTAPTTGKIKVKGRIASLLEVGTGFHPELTGRENIYLNGAILGMRKHEIARKFDEIVDFSGVERYIDTPVKRYSSGMYVRLAFAVAAHLESEILIVDEVLAVGDAEFQKKCLGKMGDISKGEGRTVLFVSHNLASVKQLCGSGLVMRNGTLVFEGSSPKAINYYLKEEKNSIVRDLSCLKDRSGDGSVTFKEFYLENENGDSISTILTGQTVFFCFNIVTNVTNSKIDLGFSIHSENDDSLSVLYSSYQNILFNSYDKRTWVVKCRITDFPFVEGAYSIGGRLLNNDIEADWPKDRIGEIMVVKGDFYNTGNLGIKGKAQYLIKGEWLSH